MKKLMIAVAAMAAGVAFADDITSNNIVGYAHTTTAENAQGEYDVCPFIGGQFFAVDGKTTFSLADISVPGSREWCTEDDEGWWECDYMEPGVEYIRVFRTDYPAESAAYTYISEDYLVDTFASSEETPDISEYKWAIGWWINTSGYDYVEAIENKNKEKFIEDMTAVTFPNGSAFMGWFFNTHAIKLQSNGEVKQVTYGFASNNGVCPLFNNQLPVDIDLSDISVPGSRTWYTEGEEGWWECDYMDPGAEYIRVFRTDYPAESAAYTYISEDYLVDTFASSEETPDVSQYAWAIGWWINTSGYDYVEAIENNDPDGKQVKTAVPVKPGFGFMGWFFDTHSLNLNFPSAIDVPSKQ